MLTGCIACVAAALAVEFHFGAHVNRLEHVYCLLELRVLEINEKNR